jgi:hypothetical protein
MWQTPGIPWPKIATALGPVFRQRRAETLAGKLNAQDVVNTLWAYATMGRAPGAGLMGELDGRAEALAGTFNAQNVANTLWAYATMGQSSGAGLMGELEGRAETLAGTFNLAPGAERQTLSLPHSLRAVAGATAAMHGVRPSEIILRGTEEREAKAEQ